MSQRDNKDTRGQRRREWSDAFRSQERQEMKAPSDVWKHQKEFFLTSFKNKRTLMICIVLSYLDYDVLL